MPVNYKTLEYFPLLVPDFLKVVLNKYFTFSVGTCLGLFIFHMEHTYEKWIYIFSCA